MNKRILKHLNPRLSRRRFLQASGAAAGAASLGLTFAPGAAGSPGGQKTLVYVFLRGGMDGLSLLPPIDGPDFGHYRDARDRTFLDIEDDDPSRRPIALNNGQNLGLHPYCQGLADIYADGGMAIVQAAGHPPSTFTRSHFDAQEQIELGQPLVVGGSGQSVPQSGWLTRYLQSSGAPASGAIFSALVSNNTPPTSLGGWGDLATLDSVDGFNPDTGDYQNTQLAMLNSLYAGSGDLDVAAGAALDAVDLINEELTEDYAPAGNAVYPERRRVADDLKLVAQLIRQDVGIAAATVDVGGWDTHNRQDVLATYRGFGENVRDLSEALTAFFRDMEGAGCIDNVAVIVQSEFGRQVTENDNQGTDHGLGNPMLVFGGSALQGGRVYGPTAGLSTSAREGDSLVPQTDFRNVIGEVAERLLGNANVDDIFQDNSFLYTPVGFAQ